MSGAVSWEAVRERIRNVSLARDRQMAVNRLIAGILTLVFNAVSAPYGVFSTAHPLAPVIAYILLGLVVAAHVLFRPTASVVRRILALGLDLVAVLYELHIGGAATAWLFPGLLWIVFGNGFRFGSGSLLFAMAVAIGGFVVMAAVTPFWRHQPALALGVVVGLAILPLYALSLIRSLSQARRQAEQASQAKSLFLASVSHELRTPLNAIIGSGTLLAANRLDAEQAELSHTIMASARSLLSLIDGILDLTRIEAGKLPIVLADFDLSRLLSDLRAIFQAQARARGLGFNMFVSARTPLLLHGDMRRLREILLSLLGNAFKFTETGHVTVAVDAIGRVGERVRLRFEVADTGIGIAPEAQGRIFETFTQADESINDRFGGTGLGLAVTRRLVRLLGGEIHVRSAVGRGSTFTFELEFAPAATMTIDTSRFAGMRGFVVKDSAGILPPIVGRLEEWGVRVVPATVEPPPSGLPIPDLARGAASILALAPARPDMADRSFAELQAGGALSFVAFADHPVTSLPPVEAQRAFTSIVGLPAHDEALTAALQLVLAGQQAAGAEGADQPLPRGRATYRLLVADDNTVNQLVMRKVLESAGHVVTVVNDGEQALDELEQHDFEAVLMDVNMPVMGGIEATKIYRFSAVGKKRVPIVGLTADAAPQTRERCLAAGMDLCLVKPIEPAQVIKALDELVEDPMPDQPQSPAASRVTDISSHPRYRGAPAPAIDADVLASLAALGGEEFVAEIVENFAAEAHAILDDLHAAAAEGDVETFRARSHALRSAAANIGAGPLCEICQPLQTVSAAELTEAPQACVGSIEAEFHRVMHALHKHGSAKGLRAQR